MSQAERISQPPRSLVLFCQGLALLGGGALFVGFWQDPERAWPNLLLVSYYLLGLGLAALVFMSLLYVTGARWGAALGRALVAMGAIIPIAAVGLGAVFLLHPSVYPWMEPSPGKVEAVAPLRQVWFGPIFFLTRAAVYLASWLLFGFALSHYSRLQDNRCDSGPTPTIVRLSAAFLVVFSVTLWLASYDWIESLEPDWSSTIFPVYQFAGLFESGLAAIILLTACLHWLGPFRKIVTQEHFHDLGKLLFGFSSFWMYTWFCQFMLIWYVNASEEVGYFARRLHGSWGPLFFLNVILNWAVPFVVLMSRATKRSVWVLFLVSLAVLGGRWLDLYLNILPYFGEPTRISAAWEIGLMIGASGSLALVFFAALRRGDGFWPGLLIRS